MKILIINGPNLNLLGKRQPEIYGSRTFDDILTDLRSEFVDVDLRYFQSNIEGELIDAVQKADGDFDAIIINAGGYTHTSVAIRDAISSVAVPCVEVHMSNIASREEFRRISLLSAVCLGSIAGFGEDSYRLALSAMKKRLS
jgi:3-dehydroquinate dehydratase-2